MDLNPAISDTDHIQFKRIRPRFKFESSLYPDEVNLKFKAGLSSGSCTCTGTSTSGFTNIHPPVEDQHFWSPQLTITVEKTNEGSLIRGLYGPQASVWTMFVFFYSAIGFATLITIMIGLSFWSLDKPSQILWLVPVLVVVFLSLYLVAYSGQKLGQQQMTNLHRFAERCLEQEIPLI